MTRFKSFPSLRFDRIEVYGRHIPSEESINLIWNEIQSDSNKIQFVKTNNIVVGYIKNGDPEDDGYISLRELIIKLNQNYREQHKILKKDNFELFWQSLAVVNLFAMLSPEKREGNIQDLRKNESRLLQFLENGKEPITIDSPRYTSLKRFPEYETASNFLIEWYEDILKTWKDNSTTNQRDRFRFYDLVIDEFQNRKSILENLENSNNPYFNVCKFCKTIFLTDKDRVGDKTIFLKSKTKVLKGKSGERTHCGSRDCKRRYSAGTSRKSRSSPALESKNKNSSNSVDTSV